jgi:hypothetical protein
MIPGLVWLCAVLGLAGLGYTGLGLWLLLSGVVPYGLLSLAVGALCGAAGWGLYRRKKWGVVLFGLVGLSGSVNHLAETLIRNADLSQAGVVQVLAALFSIVLAILIPIGVIYLVLLLWRRL